MELVFSEKGVPRGRGKVVNPNIILAKIPQLSWWARSHKELVHQDNCCESHQFNHGIYSQGGLFCHCQNRPFFAEGVTFLIGC